MSFQKILIPIFAWFWRQRLQDYKLIKVMGWRSCLFDTKYGQRIRCTFLFGYHKPIPKLFKRELDTSTWREKDLNDTSGL
jgi:hypothetical protein